MIKHIKMMIDSELFLLAKLTFEIFFLLNFLIDNVYEFPVIKVS